MEEHRAEQVARAGAVVEDDVGLVALEIDADLVLLEGGVEVARLGREIGQQLLAPLVLRMVQDLPLLDGEVALDLAEAGIGGAGAGDPQVDAGDLDRRAGVDVVVGDPGRSLLAQLRAHLRLVVAIGLERLADLVGSLGVEAADAVLGQLAVVLARQAEGREDVEPELPPDAVDVHLDLVGVERGGEDEADPEGQDAGGARFEVHHPFETAAGAEEEGGVVSTGTWIVSTRTAPGVAGALPSR